MLRSVLLSLPLALASYLAVQIVYLWELDRAAGLVRDYDLPLLLQETITVHGASPAAWLAIAALCGCTAHRAMLRLYEAQRRLVEQRERQALTDPLTGLGNRRALEERLAIISARSASSRSTPTA